MKRLLMFGFLSTGVCLSVEMACAQQRIGGFQHPESVCQSGATLFVSEIGASLEPLKKDGDGKISKVDLATGRIVDAHFLPATGGLNAPKGMALAGNILYVADIDHVLGFDIRSREKVLDLFIAGTGLLNDLVMGDGNTLYVSATDNGKIYAIDVVHNSYTTLPLTDTIAGANGLYYDGVGRRLYCVGFGPISHPGGLLYCIDLDSMRVRQLSDYRGLLDGVALVGNALYFSDWKEIGGKGTILSLDLRTHAVHAVSPAIGDIGGPADFCISADGKYFIIPATTEGAIVFRKRG